MHFSSSSIVAGKALTVGRVSLCPGEFTRSVITCYHVKELVEHDKGVISSIRSERGVVINAKHMISTQIKW